jgi:hypothetical protein
MERKSELIADGLFIGPATLKVTGLNPNQGNNYKIKIGETGFLTLK